MIIPPVDPQNLFMLSILFSAVLGIVIVPYLVALVVNANWPNAAKRWTAVAVSFLVASVQFGNEYVLTGKQSWGQLAVSVPLIFLFATMSYNQFWKPYLGPIAELDILNEIVNRAK